MPMSSTSVSPGPALVEEDAADPPPELSAAAVEELLPDELPVLSDAADAVVTAGSVTAEKLVAPLPPPQASTAAAAVAKLVREGRITGG